jgi:hypothetical protein
MFGMKDSEFRIRGASPPKKAAHFTTDLLRKISRPEVTAVPVCTQLLERVSNGFRSRKWLYQFRQNRTVSALSMLRLQQIRYNLKGKRKFDMRHHGR